MEGIINEHLWLAYGRGRLGCDEGARCVEWLTQPAPCAALITTRDVIDGARNIPVKGMRPEEAENLLDQLIAQAHEPRAFANLDRPRLIETADANPLVLQWIVGQIDLAQDPTEVLDELRHGEGTAAERVFNRSFELKQLNNGGRAVLLALSLFAPSGTRKAVAEVSGLGKENDRKKFKEAAKHLSALWLIRTTEENQRLAVEGLTRGLTKARLDNDPRGKTFRPRFASRFLRYAETHAQPTREDYNALELEKDNLLSATDVAFDRKDWATVIRMAYALDVPPSGMLRVRGYWDQALRIGELVLKAARFAKAEREVSNWLHNVAIMYQVQGELGEARRLYGESLQIAQKFGDQRGIAITLHQLGILAEDQGELSEARRLYDESLQIRQKFSDQRGIAATLGQLGNIAYYQGEWIEARRYYQQSLEISQSLSDQNIIATILHNLGVIAQDQGELSEARRLYDESLQIRQKLGDQRDIADSLHRLGILAQDQGELSEARRLYDESLQIRQKLGDQRGIATTLHELGRLHLAEEDYETAERFLQESMVILRKLGDKQNCAECLENIGKLRVEQGQLPAAEALFVEALGIAEALGIQFRIGSVKHSLGILMEKQNDKARAVQLLREAVSIFERLGSYKLRKAQEDLARVEVE